MEILLLLTFMFFFVAQIIIGRVCFQGLHPKVAHCVTVYKTPFIYGGRVSFCTQTVQAERYRCNYRVNVESPFKPYLAEGFHCGGRAHPAGCPGCANR